MLNTFKFFLNLRNKENKLWVIAWRVIYFFSKRPRILLVSARKILRDCFEKKYFTSPHHPQLILFTLNTKKSNILTHKN